MSIVTKENNPELYNALFEEETNEVKIMNEEIKKILEQLQKYLESEKYYEKGIISGSVLEEPLHLRYLKVKILLNYITNLQKENKDLKESNHSWQRKLSDYKQRNEKAIEYIKNDLQISILPNNQIINGTEVVKRINTIVNILKGGDE